MKVRVLATLLWFAAGWSGTGFLVGMAGLPTSLAFVGGLTVAMVVWFDPAGRIWPKDQARRIRPIEDVAAELEKRAAIEAPAATETASR